MSNHNEIEAQLAVYADLTGDEQYAVDMHVQECEACTAKLRAYQQMDRSLAGLMASRVQVANRRSIALPRVLVSEAQRHGAPVWWAALQFRLRRGVQRWQPVMVSAVGVVVVAFFFYTYVTYLPKQLSNVPETIQTTTAPDAQSAQAGIEAMLQRELVARHSPRTSTLQFVDPDAKREWRIDAAAILIQDGDNWQRVPLTMSILEHELVRPDLAFVRLRVDYALDSIETGRFYRHDAGQWYWTEPPVELWGEAQVLETAHLRFEYRARDAQIVKQLADPLETLYIKAHHALALPLDTVADPSNYFANWKLTFQIVPEQVTARRPGSAPVYRIISPSLESWASFDQALQKAYEAELADVIINAAMSKLRPEQLRTELGWHIAEYIGYVALSRKVARETFVQASPLPQQTDAKYTALLAELYPFSINMLGVSDATPRVNAKNRFVVVNEFVDYLEAKYSLDTAIALVQSTYEHLNTLDNAIPQFFNTTSAQFNADWNQWLLAKYESLQVAIDARQAIEQSLDLEEEAFANGDADAYRDLLDPAANLAQVRKWLMWIQSTETTPANRQRKLTLVELNVKDNLARVSVQIEQPNTVTFPLTEGRLYRWDGERWLRTSTAGFAEDASTTIETQHFRMTFQEADTAAVVQTAPVLELAYTQMVKLLQLPREREPQYYGFLRDRFEVQVTPEIITSWNPNADVLKVESPFFQSWSTEIDHEGVLAYSIMLHLVGPMLEEVNDGKNIWRWGALSGGINQWLLDETVPSSPWHNSAYNQAETERFFESYYPIRIDELQELTDGRMGFVVGRLLMNYVKEQYDQKQIAPFLRSMGEYDTWDEVTQTTFNVDATTFEAEWNQHLAEQYPELIGK